MDSPPRTIPIPSGPVECVARLLEAVSDGDVAMAARLFTIDARVIRLRYSAGRVRGGETIAVGRTAITEWLSAAVRRGVVVNATAHHFEGELLVVRTRWEMTGFAGERVQSSSLGVYHFTGGLISLFRATSEEEEEEGRLPGLSRRLL